MNSYADLSLCHSVARSDIDGAVLDFLPANVSAAGVDCVGRDRPLAGKVYAQDGPDFHKAKMNYVLRCLRKGKLYALPEDIMEQVMKECLS